MCDSPIRIPNPNFFPKTDRKKVDVAHLKYLRPWVDFSSRTIEVPCGHCKSCIRQKQDSLVQRVQFESRKNHLFMCTLTYAPEVLPSLVVGDHEIRYADVSDVRNMVKMLRKENAFGIPFRLLYVSEFGSERGRPHFHLLFLFSKDHFPLDKDDYIAACDSFASESQHYFTVLRYWRRNIGSRRVPEWIPLTRYKEKWFRGVLRKNYDFHYINPFLTSNGVEDCGMYVLKYMFKPSDRAVRLQQALRLNLDEKEYERVWSIVRPRYCASVGFGYNVKNVQLNKGTYEKDPEIVSELRACVDLSRRELDYPSYFHPFNGRQQLISPYYLKNSDIYSRDDRVHFWRKKSENTNAAPGDMTISKIREVSESRKQQNLYAKTVKHCEDLGIDADLDLLD